MTDQRQLNIGIINIMPNSIGYHQELVTALAGVAEQVSLHWIRLQSKNYGDNAATFLQRHYDSYANVMAATRLDALIITGAPVETLAFEAVSYWPELQQIIKSAVADELSTLGICWGALAIGNILGLGKISLTEKVFGVSPSVNTASKDQVFSRLPQQLVIPFSIQAHLDPADVERQVEQGLLSVLATHPQIPHALLQSSNKKHLLCLGHPEYGANRLVDEWHRDKQQQPGLAPPSGLDITQPQAHWRQVSDQLFSLWVGQTAAIAKSAATAANSPSTPNQPKTGS